MLTCLKFTPYLPLNYNSKISKSRRLLCKAENSQSQGVVPAKKESRKKVLVVGSGWAGLGAAHHLIKQGFDVTVLEGGIESGFSSYSPDEVGIQGFWYPYRNIFSLVDEIGIKPFTSWMKSAQYSEEGLEVEFPVFQELPELPTPLAPLTQTRFTRLQMLDLLTSIPLMAAVIDFDNSDLAWQKYDSITARELLKQFGCSETLYRNVIDPLLEVRLYAPAEQLSAAATLAVLYYYVAAHQKNFDMVLCRGSVREKIFDPWRELLKSKGCDFRRSRGVTDFFFNEETGSISEVLCGNDRIKADAVILAVGISTFQDIVRRSSALCIKEEFLKVLNLTSIDALSLKLRLDKKISVPKPCNACSGFDAETGWTFFELNAIFEEFENDEVTILQADFEKSYVTGLEAANRVVDYLGEGDFAKVIPLDEDEPHIEALRYLNRNLNDLRAQLPLSGYFL